MTTPMPAQGTPNGGWGGRALLLGGAIAALGVAHHLVPAGPHGLHSVHLAIQKLHFVPVVLAAYWFGWSGALPAAAGITLVFGIHIVRDWTGRHMVQAEQVADLGNVWIVAILAAALLNRIRAALRETGAAHEETLTALASSLELRERYTAGHSRRVQAYSQMLARELGVDAGDRSPLALGALFHDVGKIGMPDDILLKESRLSDAEAQEMQRHPALGASLIGRIASLREARDLVLSHHERWDGTGYPRGLAGERIPLAARIFAVADAFDAMTTTRPYQEALSYETARDRIAADRARQFAPEVVDAFLRIPYERWAELARRHGATLRTQVT